MLKLESKKREEHLKKCVIDSLPFELEFYCILKMKDAESSHRYIGSEFIVYDSDNKNFYIGSWSSSPGIYTETYSLMRLDFGLYFSYLKGEISYHKFRFESLKKFDEYYRVSIYNHCFTDEDKMIGEKVKYNGVHRFTFDTMCDHFMTIPYEYKDDYEGYSC